MESPRFNFLWEFVDYWASVNPNFRSLRHNDRVITAGEFSKKTDQLAQALLSFGVKKGDTVVTILPPGPEYVLTLIAANKIGAITTPMDVKFRAADLERFISHAEPKAIVSVSHFENYDFTEVLENGSAVRARNAKVLMVGTGKIGTPFEDVFTIDYSLEKELLAAEQSLNVDDGTLIIFTGGSTGIPKAALLSHQNVTTMCVVEHDAMKRWLAEAGLEGRLKTLAALPPSHVGGTLELIGTGIVGGMEIIMMEQWSPSGVLEVTQEEGISFIGGVPTMYAILLTLPNLDQYDLSEVKLAILSGEKVSMELLQGIKSKICDQMVIGYGSTEAGAEVTFTEPGDDLSKIAAGYVGKLLPGVEAKVVDDGDNPLPPGEVGEILVRGPLTIKGYFKMPEEDKLGFTHDGYCRTGDLGYLTEDNVLFIEGRKKHIIRVGSYTVLPTEVEEVALGDPNVGIAVAIGVPDEIYGEVVWLLVSPEYGRTVDPEAVIRRCELSLAKFKVPKKVVVRSGLPTTRIGKPDRPAIRKEILEWEG